MSLGVAVQGFLLITSSFIASNKHVFVLLLLIFSIMSDVFADLWFDEK